MNSDRGSPIYFYTRTMPYWGLSNFSPPGLTADGVYWPTVEHYFQAQKFLDPEVRESIRKAASPKQARELGQRRSHPLRENWDELRVQVMLTALRLKFSQGPARDLLLSTGDRLLAESSPFDYFWAVGSDGSGLNTLGRLLMQVREELRIAP
jgi:ribA/ribD-fused uncharacterized protein